MILAFIAGLIVGAVVTVAVMYVTARNLSKN